MSIYLLKYVNHAMVLRCSVMTDVETLSIRVAKTQNGTLTEIPLQRPGVKWDINNTETLC